MLNNFFAYLTVVFTDLKEREEGQGLVEYALILVLISIVSILIMTTVGTDIRAVFDRVANAL